MLRSHQVTLVGVLMLSGCGNGTPHQDTAEAETVVPLPGVSKVEILFRDIPFDEPRVEPRLINLCNEEESNVKSGVCKFKDGTMEMDINYGNVGGANQGFRSKATLYIADDGSLVEVKVGNFTQVLTNIAEAMTVRYGPPTQVRPNTGAIEVAPDGEFYWIDPKGTLITLRPMTLRQFGGYGSFTFESASRLESKADEKKARLEERAGNL